MDDNQIREILKKIVDEPDKCGFTAYMLVKNDPRLKLMNLEKDGLRIHLKNSIITVLEEKFLSDEAKYSTSDDIADNQNSFYIFKQNDNYRPFPVTSWNIEDFSENHLSELEGFIFLFRYDNQEIWCYQRKRSITIPNRKKTGIFASIFSSENGVIFKEQIENFVKIENTIDILIINDNLITDNIKLLERSFNLIKFISERANEVVEQIENTGFFNDNGILRKYLERKGSKEKTNLKKMLRISDSPVLSMKASDLFEKVKTLDRWKDKFKYSEDGKISINSFKDVEITIDLLEERFTKSEVSGQEYDTDVKKKVSVP